MYFARAVELAPRNPGYLYNLATAQRMTGDLSGAETSLNNFIAARPTDGEAYLMRADLRPQTSESNHVDEMTSALASQVRTPAG